MKKFFHPCNRHAKGYDFPALVQSHPALEHFLQKSPAGGITIDFGHPDAVVALNTALLTHDYGIAGWQIPEGTLCPPIPSRVDYIHHMADLLTEGEGKHRGQTLRMLDVGTGSNGIYVLLAAAVYGWQCVGSDVIDESLGNLSKVLDQNTDLKTRISLRLQSDKHQMFDGVIQPDEFYDLTVCNPPFHASKEDARKANLSRTSNMKAQASSSTPALSFGGNASELWCNGGERLFLKKMVFESQTFAHQVRWFSSLVSKAENVKPLKKWLKKLGAQEVREIAMEHGNKKTRIIAWRFKR